MIEEYGKKGFEILCVTAEPKAPTEKFVEDTKLKASVALLDNGENSRLMKAYNARGYPSSVLVDPKGTVVWAGHPSGLNGKIIEEHIKGARMGSGGAGLAVDVELPKKWAAAAKSMGKGDIGKGLSKIEKALQKNLDEESQSALEKARDEARAIFEAEWKGYEAAFNSNRYHDALVSLDLLKKHFKSHELGKKAADAHKEIKSNKELRDEIEAGRRIADAMKKKEAGQIAKARSGLERILNGPLKGTNEAQRAAKLLEELN